MLKKFLGIASLALLPVMAMAESHALSDEEAAKITGDAAAGEKVFRKCQACHQIGEGAENKVGPILTGVVGRAKASVEGFAYSDVLKGMGADGQVWGVDELQAFLEKPRDYAKGTKMAFAGLRKEDERNDVIAYLASITE